MKLENEFLYAEISEMGAEVIRIYDKENQRDICGREIRSIGNVTLRCCFRT